MRTEIWNNHKIRFVEKDNEWWAVAKDVASALGYKHTPHMIRVLDDNDRGVHIVDSTSEKAKSRNSQEMIIVSEFGIYDAIFNSRKPEAKEFKRWVFDVIKTLREQTGLEGFQVFRMLDKEHQKETMRSLSKNLQIPKRIDFIKANTITNKAISTKYGCSKMIKKEEMTPEMLVNRQPVLEDTVELMSVNDKFGLGLSVSNAIYSKHAN